MSAPWLPSMHRVTAGMRAGEAARTVLLPERLALFALITVACCGASLLAPPLGHVLLPVAVAAIAVAMWHGAYDHVLAEQTLRSSFRGHWLPVFLAGYAGLVGATLLAWRVFPVASLGLFLLYSAWHFGTEPEQFRPSPLPSFAALALGAAPIVAACRWHAAEVAPIFARMLGSHHDAARTAARLTGMLATLCLPVLLLAVAGIAAGALGRTFAQRAELLFLLHLQVALFVFCSPLAAFAVFFCCWHTPEHLLATSLPAVGGGSAWQEMGRNLRAGAVPWLLSMGMLGGALVLGRHEAAAYQGQLFLLLSALTVPHMLLNELRRSRHGRGAA